MIKIFLPTDKKVKSDVRGFWLSPDHKLYYDYLKIDKLNFNAYDFKSGVLHKYLEALKQEYKQEAIFFIYRGKGFIFNSRFNIEVLNNHSILEVKRQGRNKRLLKDYLKSALKLYGGVTVYIKDHNYILEVYHK